MARNHADRDALVLEWLHLPRIVALKLRKQHGRVGMELEDAIQEGMLGLIRAAQEWRPNGANFSTYANGAIENAVKDAWRKTHGPESGWKPEAEPETRQSDYGNGHDPRMGTVTDAVGRLPAAERAAISLYYLQGLSLAGVAEQLGRSKGACRGIIYRSLRKLRQRKWPS